MVSREVNKEVTQGGKVTSNHHDVFYKKSIFKFIVKLKEKTTCNGDDLSKVTKSSHLYYDKFMFIWDNKLALLLEEFSS